MPLKHWTLVGGAVACLIGHSAVTQAAPWLDPGDPRARHAVQKLADRGHLDRIATTWPMMWASVDAGLRERRSADGDPSVANARAYLSFEKDYQASTGFKGEFALAATSEPVFNRIFQDRPRENGEISLTMEWQGEAWALGLSPTYAASPEDDQELRLDDSYLAGTAGNWVLGAGAIDRWWGPGWSNSLILSSNARPMPSVWLNRKDAHGFETPWLSWIGPWQFTLLAGQYESEREIPDAKLIGMRLAFRPVDGLDIGLSRAIMFGGEGRPEDASTFWDALIGSDNVEGGETDPGNQLASVDARYGFALGSQSVGLYVQMMGEDEAGAFPSRKAWLLGADVTTQLGSSDQQWYAEYINTTADDFLGDAMPNLIYNHRNYRSGYRYYGRSMGASLDGDAEAIVLGGYNFFPNGNNLGASLTIADLNQDGANRTVVTDDDIFYNVPATDQSVAIATLSYGQQLMGTWLDLHASYADKQIEFISGEKDQWSLGATWRFRF
ncbi:Capsule assembly protein Wzi [Marinobacter daqiaonensis]|uniref:Capsule assembly protein Wzi n=1 Tax=Marinobacter daqiaonensis TaxID=650891 RepID=A0A1I6HAK8_9GAMM|nr:capsule assembly Wzi family protein [Marinobacter daqiaonensis]SFR51307.1 Capsule assembly protein Wzi [Marinobacter daqiaonensis]